jgi:hypothetical protein
LSARLTPQQAKQLHRKASEELVAVYRDSLVQGSQAFRTKQGIKEISRDRGMLTVTCRNCGLLIDDPRYDQKFHDQNCRLEYAAKRKAPT